MIADCTKAVMDVNVRKKLDTLKPLMKGYEEK